jgi:hypothetical protein
LISEEFNFLTPEQAFDRIKKKDNALLESVDSSSSKENIKLESESVENLRILFLKNLNKLKTSNDVERYAFQLTRINPVENSSELVDSKTGKWLVRFKSDIGKN